MQYLIYILPGGAIGTFLTVFIVLTWWFEEVHAKTRRNVLATLGALAIISVGGAVVTAVADDLGWIDVAMPYDEPEPLILPDRSPPPPASAGPPKLESKTQRTTIEQARDDHEQKVDRFE
jgi:hypothetical protein